MSVVADPIKKLVWLANPSARCLRWRSVPADGIVLIIGWCLGNLFQDKGASSMPRAGRRQDRYERVAGRAGSRQTSWSPGYRLAAASGPKWTLCWRYRLSWGLISGCAVNYEYSKGS